MYFGQFEKSLIEDDLWSLCSYVTPWATNRSEWLKQVLSMTSHTPQFPQG